MAEEFPDVPDLDFGAVPSSQPAEIPPAPVQPTPAPTPAPTEAPEVQAVSRGVSSELDESVDEILTQASEQMLQLAKLEDGLRDVMTNLDDVSEQVVTGFLELKQAAATPGRGAASTADGGDNAARFAELELQAEKATRQQGNLLILGLVQLVLLAALGIWLFVSPSDTSSAPATTITTSPTPTTAPTSSGVESHSDSDAGSQKKDAPKNKSRKKRRRR